MGMFDHVAVAPGFLPHLKSLERDCLEERKRVDLLYDFQTKALDRMLDTYYITPKGRLYKVYTPWGPNKLRKAVRPHFTGHINFYTLLCNQMWIEFGATFIDDVCIQIEKFT